MTSDVAVLVVAAGAASRMGADKLLLAYQGKPLLAYPADAALAAGLAATVVTSPEKAAAYRVALGARAVGWIGTPPGAFGMGHSIASGIRSLGHDVRAAIICLADMPLVSVDLLTALAERATERAIIIPEFGGKRGNPVLWGRTHFPLLAQLRGDAGGRSLLDQLRADIIALPWPDDSIHRDIDTPEDLAELLATT